MMQEQFIINKGTIKLSIWPIIFVSRFKIPDKSISCFLMYENKSRAKTGVK